MFDIYVDYFKGYDSQILSIEGIQWLPWFGVNYDSKINKTYILGESHYLWNKNKDSVNQLSNMQFTRYIIANQGLYQKSKWEGNNGKKWKVFRNFERAYFLDKYPSYNQIESLWNQTAFSNLVLKYMPKLGDRPRYEDYVQGWRVHLEIFKISKPDTCIVIGNEQHKVDALFEALPKSSMMNVEYSLKIGNTKPKITKIHLNGKEIKVIFIKHTSSFFSWSKWGEYLNTKL